MADLDAELLALAGDSSDEEPSKVTKTDRPSSPDASDHGDSAAGRRTTGRNSGKGKAGAKKGGRHDEPEEGEAMSESDEVAMSESDGDVDSSGEGSEPTSKYPIEGKFISEKDKAEVLALPEVQREAILAERAAELEREQQDRTLKRLYQSYQQKGQAATGEKKRKAADADLKDGQRKSTRQKTTLGGRKVGETSDAMEAYKRQREQRGALAEQQKANAAERKARQARGSSEPSDLDAEGESDVEWDEGKAKSGLAKAEPVDEGPPRLDDFNRIHVGRWHFGKVCFYPGFEAAIKDCYIRVAVGADPRTGDTVYRMARIEGFTEGKPYALEGSNGKPFVTTQHVVSSIGKSRREWPFIFCSMTKFSESELDRYISTLNSEGLSLPKKPQLVAKIEDINRLNNRAWTDAELQDKLKRSGVLQQKQNAIERQILSTRRLEAENRGDMDAVDQIDEQVRALANPKLAYNTSISKAQTASPAGKTQQQRLAEINAANRKADRRDVRQALLAEKKAASERRAAVERGEAQADPFARVKVMAKTHFDASGQSIQAAKPVARKEEEPVAAAVAAPKQVNGATTAGGEDLELPRKQWSFDYVALSNDCLGPRAHEHKRYDQEGRRVSIWPRRMCDDEVLARMDLDIDCIEEIY